MASIKMALAIPCPTLLVSFIYFLNLVRPNSQWTPQLNQQTLLHPLMAQSGQMAYPQNLIFQQNRPIEHRELSRRSKYDPQLKVSLILI